VIRRIGFVAKPEEQRARKVVEEIAAWASARGIALCEDCAQADLVVVLGGDGTMLRAAHVVGERETPVLGVNFGTLGYLTEFTDRTLFPALDEIARGDFALDPRVMISCAIERGGETISRELALNDVVVNKSALARITEIDAWIDGRFVSNFRADGLIVSTPTGSTAYNLSAGGPILLPTMGAFVLNPICPHTLSNRPLVVPDTVGIELVLRSAQEVMATIDGQIGVDLQAGDRIRLRKSATAFNVITPRDRNYFQVLRDKLRWGGQIASAGRDEPLP